MIDSSIVSNISKRIEAWVLSNYSLSVDYEIGIGNAELRDNGAGIITITRWDLACPQPTQTDLENITDKQLDTIFKTHNKNRFYEVASTLIVKESKFALVYDMIKAICIEKLSMSELEYVALSQSVYNDWVDKQ